FFAQTFKKKSINNISKFVNKIYYMNNSPEILDEIKKFYYQKNYHTAEATFKDLLVKNFKPVSSVSILSWVLGYKDGCDYNESNMLSMYQFC
ncbi:hypothetical protein N9L02_03585, partial [Gammaproteobacteria bacterium]|nr:hypothetical protein [Gammaproteobacteria bacterium]MDA8562171.1 hypothetical protein [Gammaproteobacteria bacterium]